MAQDSQKGAGAPPPSKSSLRLNDHYYSKKGLLKFKIAGLLGNI